MRKAKKAASAILLIVIGPIVLILLCLDISNGISLYIAIASLPKPPAPLHLRDIAELLSFCATIVIPILTVIAGWVAFRQFQSAEKTRLVSVYMAISEKWDSDGIADARRQLRQLEKFYQTHKTALKSYNTPSDYIHAVIADSGSGSALDKNYLTLMSYLEDIGLLCSNDYLHIDDVNNIIGDGIKSMMQALLVHIEAERATISKIEPKVGAALYANALRLYQDLEKMESVTIPGYGAPD